MLQDHTLHSGQTSWNYEIDEENQLCILRSQEFCWRLRSLCKWWVGLQIVDAHISFSLSAMNLTTSTFFLSLQLNYVWAQFEDSESDPEHKTFPRKALPVWIFSELADTLQGRFVVSSSLPRRDPSCPRDWRCPRHLWREAIHTWRVQRRWCRPTHTHLLFVRDCRFNSLGNLPKPTSCTPTSSGAELK